MCCIPRPRPSTEQAAAGYQAVMNDDEFTAANGNAESQLHAAAWSGDLDRVKAIVESGADINWRDSVGETALFGACAWGQVAVVEYLLSHGAEFNVREQSGLTPLHWAASHGGIETLRMLIGAGADPGAADDTGRLPVDLARKSGKGDRVAYLKSLGPPTESRRKT